jgi:hypothetical protein
LPRNPAYTESFVEKVNSNDLIQYKEKIEKICARLCNNHKAANGHQLRYNLCAYWAADIAVKGRGNLRIIFQIHCPESPQIEEGQIVFVDIQDYH